MSKKNKKNKQPIIVQTSGGGTSPTALWIIILLLVGVILYGANWLNEQRKANPLEVVGITQIADIEPATTIDEVVDNINNMEVTPGPASEGALATAIPPWTRVEDVGEVAKLEAALNNRVATAGIAVLAGARLQFGSSSTYCMAVYTPDIEVNEPLVDLVRAEEIFIVPGTRYCYGANVLGDLIAGVPYSDVKDVALDITDRSNTNIETRVVTETQSVGITMTLRFGLLARDIYPGNIQILKYEEPGHFVQSLVELGVGRDNVQANINNANNLALQRAMEEMVAPYFPDGSRDMSHLNQLQEMLFKVFNQSSGDPNNPWPYDILLEIAEYSAQQGGYTQLDFLKVNLVWPGEEGDWYNLDGLDTNPIPVLDPNSFEKYSLNLYPLWEGQITPSSVETQ